MTEKLLKESAPAPLVKSGKRWLVVCAVPGVGSSGTYSEEMLREFGPAALPPNSKAFFDHDPQRSIKDMVGTYPDGAYWNEGLGRLEAELQPFKHWQEVVDEIGPYAEASIYMMGESDESGNVLRLIPSRTNSVDLVGYGGLEGSGLVEQIEKLTESARALDGESGKSPDSSTNKETQNMDELTKLVESLVADVKSMHETLDTVVALQEANSSAATDKVDAFEVADELSKAVAEAKLPETGRKRVLESVKAGKTLAESVAEEVAYIKSITEGFVPAGGAGRINEFAASAADVTISRWN